MREIKFRAWDMERNEWCYSDTNGLHDFFYGLQDGQLDRETLGESTGLHDKKRTEEYPEGQEIYEGDIVTEDEQLWKIVWDVNKLAGFEAQNEDDENYYLGGAGWERCEVIGNIYENPELLK